MQNDPFQLGIFLLHVYTISTEGHVIVGVSDYSAFANPLWALWIYLDFTKRALTFIHVLETNWFSEKDMHDAACRHGNHDVTCGERGRGDGGLLMAADHVQNLTQWWCRRWWNPVLDRAFWQPERRITWSWFAYSKRGFWKINWNIRLVRHRKQQSNLICVNIGATWSKVVNTEYCSVRHSWFVVLIMVLSCFMDVKICVFTGFRAKTLQSARGNERTEAFPHDQLLCSR